MSDSAVVPRRKRGLAATLTPEESRRHFAELGRHSGAGRLILTHEETQSLLAAYELLAGAAQRARAKVEAKAAPESEVAA
jgi:hypothetical protein